MGVERGEDKNDSLLLGDPGKLPPPCVFTMSVGIGGYVGAEVSDKTAKEIEHKKCILI